MLVVENPAQHRIVYLDIKADGKIKWYNDCDCADCKSGVVPASLRMFYLLSHN